MCVHECVHVYASVLVCIPPALCFTSLLRICCYSTVFAFTGVLLFCLFRTQVVVGDVDSDGVTDIIVGDESGNIQCLDVKGTMKWEKSVDAAVSGGLRLADLEGNERMDVVVVTQDG